MGKVALVVGLAAFLPFPAFAENQMLDGTYKLLSATRKIVETSEVVDSFGKHPTGYISYGKDGMRGISSACAHTTTRHAVLGLVAP